MLEHFFESAYVIRQLREGPAGPHIEGFAGELYREGYAGLTARRHLRAASHLIFWMMKRKHAALQALNEAWVERFRRHLPSCLCKGYGHRDRFLPHGARLFLGYLRRVGIVSAATTGDKPKDPVLLDEFRCWMQEQRGTSVAVVQNYSYAIRDFLDIWGEDAADLDAHGLRQFILEGSQRWGRAKARQSVTALRMFVRFLIAQGRCRSGLDAAIPALSGWGSLSLPRFLSPADVERTIAACDRTSQVGIRDRAIVLLLARLGLRAGDIVQLRIGDINWREAWIAVSGKARYESRLPLSQEVGDAIIAYLKKARPPVETDVLFLRSRAPLRGFAGHPAVSVIVAQAMRKAGVIRPTRGAAHLLRHSAATAMLTKGASLQDIAVLLRHRSIETTQIYAKVDLPMLRMVVQPWPEVEPC